MGIEYKINIPLAADQFIELLNESIKGARPL